MGTPTFKLAGLSKSKTGVHKEGKMSQYEVYRGVSDFLRPRDPFFILLKSVSRRREKKERLRRDAAPGNAKLQFGMSLALFGAFASLCPLRTSGNTGHQSGMSSTFSSLLRALCALRATRFFFLGALCALCALRVLCANPSFFPSCPQCEPVFVFPRAPADGFSFRHFYVILYT